jgi:hypothetical protein
MAVRCAVVILGIRSPLAVVEMSSIALAAGAAPVELIATFCATETAAVANINRVNVFFIPIEFNQ